MNRDTEAVILIVTGGLVGRLVVEGGFQSYVRPGMYWPLLLAAACVIGAGLLTFFGAGTTNADHDEASHEPDHTGHHDHAHGGRVGALLLVPLALLLATTPTSLGAYAAQRTGPSTPVPVSSDDAASIELPPLPQPTDGAVEVSLRDVLLRTQMGRTEDLEDTPLRLEGFVVQADEPTDGYLLTRFAIACCAADGTPLQLHVVGTDTVPEDDTWVRIEGQWTGTAADTPGLPVIEATSQEPIPEPHEPYE